MSEIFSILKSSTLLNQGLTLSDFKEESEGKEYHAARFNLGGERIIYRKAKITPKKIGQFVTCWKRNPEGITEPFHVNYNFDFYIIDVQSDRYKGLFVLPKTILAKKGIVSTETKDGKRGFRIYPPWDEPTSKQAIRTQKWQIEYFIDSTKSSNLLNILKFTS